MSYASNFGYGTIGTLNASQPLQIGEAPPSAPEQPQEERQTGQQVQTLIDHNMSRAMALSQFTPYGSGGVQTTAHADIFGLQINAVGVPAPTYRNFNLMRDEPMVEIGRAVVDAMICNSQMVVEAADGGATDDATKSRVEKIRQTWAKLWGQLLYESSFAMDDGNHSLECVWGRDNDGWQRIVSLEPLAVESTWPLVYNDSMTFAGVRNYSIYVNAPSTNGDGSVDLSPEYCIRIVNASKAGNLYGRSRFMASRGWIKTKWDLKNKLGISGDASVGNLFDISYPVSDRAMTDPLFAKETAANALTAQAIGMAMGKSGFITRPTIADSLYVKIMTSPNAPNLTREEMGGFKINTVATKQNAFADFAKAFDVCDEQILIGLGVLPQAVKEGDNSGSRAVAGTHSATLSTLNTPRLAYLSSLIQDKVDLECELNDGPAARGTVKVYGKISDDTVDTIEQILITLLSKDLPTMAKLVEIKPLLAKIGWAPRNGFDQDKLLADSQAQTEAANAAKVAALTPQKDTNNPAAPAVPAKIAIAASADDGDGHWVTIEGAHVFIGKGGTIEKGPAHLIGKTPAEASKTARPTSGFKSRNDPSVPKKKIRADNKPLSDKKSKFIGQKVGKAEHEHADANEKMIAKYVGGTHETDHEPTDVVIRDGNLEHDIEVKSLLKGNKNSLSVHDDALSRKINYANADSSRRFHTVAVDHRDRFGGGDFADKHSGHDLYYKRGAGRYTLSKMHKVSGPEELNSLIRMKDSELPENARGSLPTGDEAEKIKASGGKAHAARLKKDRAIRARRKAQKGAA